jgi:two-component system, NtrC family, sensor kinase
VSAPGSPEVVVVGGDVESRREAVVSLREALGPTVRVGELATGSDGGVEVPPATESPEVLVVLAGGAPLDRLLDDLADAGVAPRARTLVVTHRTDHDELSEAFDQRQVDGILSHPLDAGTLAHHVRGLLRRASAGGTGPAATGGPSAASQPASAASRPGSAAARPGADDGDATATEVPTRGLLRDLELDDRTIARRLLAALDHALGPRPVLRLKAGTRLTHQGEDVNGVFVVRDGSVALDRETAVGRLRLHHASTGPVVGLLSLTQRRRAYFTAVATTDVEVVHLTLEQLDLALHSDPEVGAAMATAAVQALARRLRRSEHLQIEREQLNRALDHERRELATALKALEATRFELVEQARMATLGELAAGVAHELNNPVAALERAAAYVADDIAALLADHPRGDVARDALERARHRPPASTAEERAARRGLAARVGDELARRLVAAGVDDPETAARLAADPATLEVVERAADLGGAVRNLELAGHRISDLTDSLRTHARPQQAPVEGVDLHVSVDDALRLVSHRLHDIEVDRRYGSLPPVRAHPGPLSQVWTNLLVNAADALDGEGRIEVRTSAPDPDHVRVEIIDDGPGIDPEMLPRLLEPRFTTKEGVVRYGLGLGLPIAKRIVDAHGGRLDLASQPGRTVATVTLPVAGPDDGDDAGEGGRRGARPVRVDHEEHGA